MLEYYSARNKEWSSDAGTTEMNLGDIMPREISPTRKDKYFMIPLIRVT